MKTNEVTKQPKEIKAEISFEIIGEDEPTKYDKRRKRCAVGFGSFHIKLLAIWIEYIFFGCHCH